MHLNSSTQWSLFSFFSNAPKDSEQTTKDTTVSPRLTQITIKSVRSPAASDKTQEKESTSSSSSPRKEESTENTKSVEK